MATNRKDQKHGDPAPRLTEREAWDMWQAGFRFSIFDPTTDTYVPMSPAETRGPRARDAVPLDL